MQNAFANAERGARNDFTPLHYAHKERRNAESGTRNAERLHSVTQRSQGKKLKYQSD